MFARVDSDLWCESPTLRQEKRVKIMTERLRTDSGVGLNSGRVFNEKENVGSHAGEYLKGSVEEKLYTDSKDKITFSLNSIQGFYVDKNEAVNVFKQLVLDGKKKSDFLKAENIAGVVLKNDSDFSEEDKSIIKETINGPIYQERKRNFEKEKAEKELARSKSVRLSRIAQIKMIEEMKPAIPGRRYKEMMEKAKSDLEKAENEVRKREEDLESLLGSSEPKLN